MNDIINLLELQSFYEDVMQDEALTDAELLDLFEETIGELFYDDPYRMTDVSVNEDRYER